MGKWGWVSGHGRFSWSGLEGKAGGCERRMEVEGWDGSGMVGGEWEGGNGRAGVRERERRWEWEGGSERVGLGGWEHESSHPRAIRNGKTEP